MQKKHTTHISVQVLHVLQVFLLCIVVSNTHMFCNFEHSKNQTTHANTYSQESQKDQKSIEVSFDSQNARAAALVNIALVQIISLFIPVCCFMCMHYRLGQLPEPHGLQAPAWYPLLPRAPGGL